MGVTIRGDDLMLFHNPEFILATPVDQLEGVLIHEVNHVVLGHLIADPADYPDEWARVVAEEVTVNEHVKLPLPEGVVTLDQFPDLPPLGSTRERYERLAASAARGPAGPTERGEGVRTVDDHSVWAEARLEPSRSREAVCEAIAGAIFVVGNEALPGEWKRAIEAMGFGTEVGQDAYQLRGDTKGNLDWRLLLRRYVGQALEIRPAFNRPPRRFPDLIGVLPGRRRQAARPRVLGVIDTSASITDELLERIDAELSLMATKFAVTVVECDEAIHRVYPYRRLASILGRGGTDLRPPLEPAFLREHRADLVVYFTDGHGEAPERPPGPPVVWCLTPGGEAPTTWGRVINMGPGG